MVLKNGICPLNHGLTEAQIKFFFFYLITVNFFLSEGT